MEIEGLDQQQEERLLQDNQYNTQEFAKKYFRQGGGGRRDTHTHLETHTRTHTHTHTHMDTLTHTHSHKHMHANTTHTQRNTKRTDLPALGLACDPTSAITGEKNSPPHS